MIKGINCKVQKLLIGITEPALKCLRVGRGNDWMVPLALSGRLQKIKSKCIHQINAVLKLDIVDPSFR